MEFNVSVQTLLEYSHSFEGFMIAAYVFCAPDCPVGWIVGYDECYLFHQNPLTWQDAMVRYKQ